MFYILSDFVLEQFILKSFLSGLKCSLVVEYGTCEALSLISCIARKEGKKEKKVPLSK